MHKWHDEHNFRTLHNIRMASVNMDPGTVFDSFDEGMVVHWCDVHCVPKQQTASTKKNLSAHHSQP